MGDDRRLIKRKSNNWELLEKFDTCLINPKGLKRPNSEPVEKNHIVSQLIQKQGQPIQRISLITLNGKPWSKICFLVDKKKFLLVDKSTLSIESLLVSMGELLPIPPRCLQLDAHLCSAFMLHRDHSYSASTSMDMLKKPSLWCIVDSGHYTLFFISGLYF